MSCLIWSKNDLTIKLVELRKQIPIAKEIWISIHLRNIGRCLTICRPTVYLHPICPHHRITPSEFLCNGHKFIVWSKQIYLFITIIYGKLMGDSLLALGKSYYIIIILKLQWALIFNKKSFMVTCISTEIN